MKILLPLVLLLVFSTSVKCDFVVDGIKYLLDALNYVGKALYTVRNAFLTPWFALLKFARDELLKQLKSYLYPFLPSVLPNYDELRLVIEHAETLFCWSTDKIIEGFLFSDAPILLRYFFGFMESLSYYAKVQVDKFKTFLNETLDEGALAMVDAAKSALNELESLKGSAQKTRCLKFFKKKVKEFSADVYNVQRLCIDELLNDLEEQFEYLRNLTVVYPQAALNLTNRISECIDSITDSIFNIYCILPIAYDAIEIGFTFFTAPKSIAKYLLKFTTNVAIKTGKCYIMIGGRHANIRSKFQQMIYSCTVIPFKAITFGTDPHRVR